MTNILVETWRHSDWLGKLDLIILLVLSIYSWAIIIEKHLLYKKTEKDNRTFLKNYYNGRITNTKYSVWGKILSKSLKEKQNINPSPEKISNLLKRTSREEFYTFEKGMAFLMLTAAISPFLGLLGTVWGLLLSFHSIGMTGSASMSVVASGVGEALISTVAGLVVAIPAAAGHNLFNEKLRILQKEGDDILESFYLFLK
ncbi:MAG: MotA/TolQ/ExbB proton channel family protein [Candidatus Omnitrophica bacterium]|nr:MotA/TolQ/ExbB proton channel family protein [Candidatus Omnitrophota bacterium]